VSETTLVKLPAGGGVFDESNLDAIQAMIAAQNLNNTSLRAGINACATTPVPSSQLDPSTIQYATVALTNTQTKALNSAPPAIIAAAGAGTLIEVLSAVLENVFLTAAFANGGVIQLSYGASTTVPASATVAATFLTSPTASQVIVLAGALATNLASAVLNTAVYLASATADFITGAGHVTVKVAYRVHSGL
jgi:hypothetical protein